MLVSERREMLLKALRGSFGEKEFCVKNILRRVPECEKLLAAIEANCGKSIMRCKQNLVAIKVGRLLEQKLSEKKFGAYELRQYDKRGGANYYKVSGPPVAKAAPEPLHEAHVPPKIEYETETTYDSRTGHITEKLLRNADGSPRVKRPDLMTAAPAPKPAEVEQAPDEDKRPPWLRRGESKARDKAEWLAWQKKRREPPHVVECESPGLPMAGVSAPNGIRTASTEVSTLWNGTFRGL